MFTRPTVSGGRDLGTHCSTWARFPLRETLFFGTFLAFYLVPVQVTKLYLHFFTAYFRARRILPFHLLPPPFPPLGTSLPGGKLRPLEGSAPFLGGRPTTMCGPAMVEIHMVVGTQGAVPVPSSLHSSPFLVFLFPFLFPFSFFLPPAS